MAKPNLDNMSRDQMLDLLDLLEEKEQRAKQTRALYVPHSGQAPVHQSDKQLRFVFSGNGAGKTTLGCNEVLWAVQGYNPILKTYTAVPCRAFVVLDKPEKVESVILPELRKWTAIEPEQLHKKGKPYVSYISFPNGSSITFLFFDQDPLTAEGLEGDFFWIDEPPPRGLFVSLRRGGRTKGRVARYLMTGTPLAAPWLRREIYDKWMAGELPEAECFRFNTELNRANLADGYIEAFSRVLSEKERRIRLAGEFFDLDGLALAHLFRREVHVIGRPDYWSETNPCIVAIDPHPSKAHHAIMLGVDKDGWLHYMKELKRKEVPRQFAHTMKEWLAGHRVVDIVCDSLGSSEGTGGEGFLSFIQVLQREGIRVRATRWDEKNDEDFIARIQEVLTVPEEADNFGRKLPKLRIWAGNPGIVMDVENVQWIKMRGLDEVKPKLDISNKDFLSSLKYALAANPHFGKGKEKVYTRPIPTGYGASKPGIIRQQPRGQRRKVDWDLE